LEEKGTASAERCQQNPRETTPGPASLSFLPLHSSATSSPGAGRRPPVGSPGAVGPGAAGVPGSLLARAVREAPAEDLRAAWVEFLGRWTWDLFGSHTFREDAHPEAAMKRFRLFVSILNRKLYGPRWYKQGRGIRWVCAMERQARGVVHFHSLLASPELVELLRASWRPGAAAGRWKNEVNELWNALAGFARIGPIESPAAVQRYVSKYVTKERREGEIDLGGPGMHEVKRAGYPARVDRPWLATAIGRATAQAILEQVTTEEERAGLRSWAEGLPGSRRGTAALRGSVRLRALAARVQKPLASAN